MASGRRGSSLVVAAVAAARVSPANGIDPGSIENGDTLSVAWGNGTDLASGGTVNQLSGSLTGGNTLTDITGDNLSITNGTLNASTSGGGISSLSGGQGINPDSIGDNDTLSVASGDIAGTFLSTDGSNNLTVNARKGLENANGSLQASLGNALGFAGSNTDQIAVTTDSLTVAGNSVSLGGSTDVAYTDLSDTGSSFLIPNGDLANSSVTVSVGNGLQNGGQASLGGSTTLNVGSGRYIATSSGQVDFNGPVEWSNAGDTTNTVSGTNAVVAGGTGNTASAQETTVGGGNDNTADAASTTVPGGRDNTASGEAATVGGGQNSDVQGEYGTIAGGRPSDPDSSPDTTNNVVFDNYGTIGGGGNNQAGSDDSDPTTAQYATVGGGDSNTASGSNTTIGGGSNNAASGFNATVGGGFDNTASGFQATVPGGGINEASESNAFAAGRKAKARASGVFVWGESSNTAVESTTPNGVVFQAGGGVTL